MNGPEKKSYTPPPAKRYDISRDELSQRRFDVLRGMYGELTATLPSLGLSLFGSLSKGKPLSQESARHADIDLTVYVDSDELDRKIAELSQKYPGYLNWRKAFNEIRKSAVPDFSRSDVFEEFIRALIIERMKDSEPLFDMKNMSHVVVSALPIGTYEQHPDSLRRGAMYALFHLDVGGGLKKYRRAFLNGLAKLSEGARQRLWGEVYDEVLFRERLMTGDAVPAELAKQFPKTYEEAYRYYVGEPLPQLS
jgi:hypothetical protein